MSAKIAARWVEHYKAEGRASMADRLLRPAHIPLLTEAGVTERIVALRRHIAHAVGASPTTVCRMLKRAGLSRLKDIEPAAPIRRYEREHAGEIIHIDIKKLGRLARSAIAVIEKSSPTAGASAGSSSMSPSTSPFA